jgi:hypothetical protein
MNVSTVRRNASLQSLPRLLIACALFIVSTAGMLQAQQDERAVRAAFVYNLAKYVRWPNQTREITVCAAGSDNMGPLLKTVIDGKDIDGRPIHVLLQPVEANVSRCDIVYVSKAASTNTKTILARIRGTTILTVGEEDTFVGSGGMVGLVRIGDRMVLEVDLDTVRAAGLSISSRLLDLAVTMHSGRRN